MQNIIKASFKEWTLDKLDAEFGLKQVRDCKIMKEWLAMSYTPDEYEKRYISDLQEILNLGGDEWNEVELENKFISPLFNLIKFDNLRFAYFLERNLRSVIGNYDLSGIVDGLIATGYRSPNIPFFCMHEYKRAIDNEGHPNAQNLVAMLVAREQNSNQKPIYGLFIVGSIWQFMVLNGNEYCISKKYDAAEQSVYDIFSALKGLKVIIETKLLG